MRERARRVFGYAVLASLVLHALVFYVVPAAREFAALVPPEPEPLIARVEQLEPPPAPAPAPAARPNPKPKPAAQPEAPQPVPSVPVPVPVPRAEPVPVPAPAVAPVAVPAPPAPEPASEPVVQAPVPAPAPLARAAPQPPSPDAGAITRFRQGILRTARADKRYPRVAVDNLWEGKVGVRMSIGADGRIAALRVTRGSGHAVLDREALRLFETAQSRVPIPRELRGQAFEIDLEAVYDLTDQRSGWNTTTWSTSRRMPICSPSAWLWWLGTSASTRRPLASLSV